MSFRPCAGADHVLRVRGGVPVEAGAGAGRPQSDGPCWRATCCRTCSPSPGSIRSPWWAPASWSRPGSAWGSTTNGTDMSVRVRRSQGYVIQEAPLRLAAGVHREERPTIAQSRWSSVRTRGSGLGSTRADPPPRRAPCAGSSPRTTDRPEASKAFTSPEPCGLTSTRSASEYKAAAQRRGPHRCPRLERQTRRARLSREPGIETRRRHGGAAGASRKGRPYADLQPYKQRPTGCQAGRQQ